MKNFSPLKRLKNKLKQYLIQYELYSHEEFMDLSPKNKKIKKIKNLTRQ